jgi:hypothetical protein
MASQTNILTQKRAASVVLATELVNRDPANAGLSAGVLRHRIDKLANDLLLAVRAMQDASGDTARQIGGLQTALRPSARQQFFEHKLSMAVAGCWQLSRTGWSAIWMVLAAPTCAFSSRRSARLSTAEAARSRTVEQLSLPAKQFADQPARSGSPPVDA